MVATLAAYGRGILIALDVLTNALLGGEPYQTLSCRIGVSIASGGWAAWVPWPAWFRAHCAAAVFQTLV